MTKADWYERVNETWPKEIPTLSAEEAIAAGRKLYRFGMKKTFRGPVRVTSGNRYTWIRRGEMLVNPGHGWHGLVHLLSHYCHRRMHPDEQPHGRVHAQGEIRMIKEVIRRGWLAGSLRKAAHTRAARALERKAYQDSPDFKLARLRDREKAWVRRANRAATALRKLRSKIRRIEAAHQS